MTVARSIVEFMSLADAIQTMVATLTVIGLLITVVYNQRSLRAARQDSVTSMYLGLNERLQETLYELLEVDKDILKSADLDKLRPYQFRFFQLFDIVADIWQMRPMLEEFDPRLWRRCDARIRPLLRKRAFRILWAKQLAKNAALFDREFVEFMTAAMAELPHDDPAAGLATDQPRARSTLSDDVGALQAREGAPVWAYVEDRYDRERTRFGPFPDAATADAFADAYNRNVIHERKVATGAAGALNPDTLKYVSIASYETRDLEARVAELCAEPDPPASARDYERILKQHRGTHQQG